MRLRKKVAVLANFSTSRAPKSTNPSLPHILDMLTPRTVNFSTFALMARFPGEMDANSVKLSMNVPASAIGRGKFQNGKNTSLLLPCITKYNNKNTVQFAGQSIRIFQNLKTFDNKMKNDFFFVPSLPRHEKFFSIFLSVELSSKFGKIMQ